MAQRPGRLVCLASLVTLAPHWNIRMSCYFVLWFYLFISNILLPPWPKVNMSWNTKLVIESCHPRESSSSAVCWGRWAFIPQDENRVLALSVCLFLKRFLNHSMYPHYWAQDFSSAGQAWGQRSLQPDFIFTIRLRVSTVHLSLRIGNVDLSFLAVLKALQTMSLWCYLGNEQQPSLSIETHMLETNYFCLVFCDPKQNIK